MMTPEERARALSARLADYHQDSHLELADYLDDIAAAIRAAVDAERERCAAICDQEAAQWEARLADNRPNFGVVINSAIEARTLAGVIRAGKESS
jgi:hypothetical protein